MKGLILTIVFLFSFGKIHSQVKDTLPPTYLLDTISQAEMEKFESAFNKWFFDKYCKKMKIKISCAGCSKFIYSLLCEIDSFGKLVIIKEELSKYCGSELTEVQKKEFKKGLNNFRFSDLLRNKIFKFRFARILKC